MSAPPSRNQPLSGDLTASGTISRKGDETRRRILDAALRAFGSSGYRGATTRSIAADAGVNLPALKYYFGGKEGLYLACARAIVGQFAEGTAQAATSAISALAAELTPQAARHHLKEVLGALAETVAGDRTSDAATSFALREMTDRGPAFEILYDLLWAPGVDLVADLIARAMGETDRSEAARVRALLLISSLFAFSTSRPVALRYLDWPNANDERFRQIRQVVDEQVDRIGAPRANDLE